MKNIFLFIFPLLLVGNGATAQSQIVLGKSRTSKVTTSTTIINSNKYRLEINITAIYYEKKTFPVVEFV